MAYNKECFMMAHVQYTEQNIWANESFHCFFGVLTLFIGIFQKAVGSILILYYTSHSPADIPLDINTQVQNRHSSPKESFNTTTSMETEDNVVVCDLEYHVIGLKTQCLWVTCPHPRSPLLDLNFCSQNKIQH